jgi:hypothetical protein
MFDVEAAMFEIDAPPCLSELPRWAVVAFAARCVRRVEPLVLRGEQCYEDHMSKAIEMAEKLAAKAYSSADRNVALADHKHLTKMANRLLNGAVFCDGRETKANIISSEFRDKFDNIAADDALKACLFFRSVRHSLNAGRLLIEATACAASPVLYETVEYCVGRTKASAETSIRSCKEAAVWCNDLTFQSGFSMDLKLIIKASHDNKWHHNTPVPPSVFGNLWPNGPPVVVVPPHRTKLGWFSWSKYD